MNKTEQNSILQPRRFRVDQIVVLKLLLLATGFLVSLYAWMAIAFETIMMGERWWMFRYGEETAAYYQSLNAISYQLAPVFSIIPFLWIGLVFLKREHFRRIQWLLLMTCLWQGILARTFEFCVLRFQGDWTIDHARFVFPDVSDVRQLLSTSERILYGPLLRLIELDLNVFTLLIYSFALAAIATGILYALARTYRRLRGQPLAGETVAETGADAGSATDHA